MSLVCIVGVEAGMRLGEYVMAVKDGGKTFCGVLGFEDDEGTTEVPAKTRGPVMEQLLGVNAGDI